ncbi:MAG: metallophosphoesterase family protein [Paludibacteraceae bacterium]|nr:metallophosphoesterase family protein [Paludibacteraceae bacterium]
MTRIGLLSDTHGLLDPRIFEHFDSCDEIWHAGDIGSAELLQRLREFRPTRAVFGNMDSGDVRYSLSEFYRFRVEDVNVLMTHIGGYPGHYNPWLIPWFKKSLEAKQALQNAQINAPNVQINAQMVHAPYGEADRSSETRKEMVHDQIVNAPMVNAPMVNAQMVHDQMVNAPYGEADRSSETRKEMVNVIDLFVCGHSHILKVQYDPLWKMLTLNPGAAGKQGWQTVQTLLRFTIDAARIDNLEVIELSRS